MRYNYVIFGTDNDYFKAAYGDVIGLKNVRYITKRIDVKSKLVYDLFRLHKNKKINGIVPLPFKNFWNKYAFRGKFDNDAPVCFIFFEGVEWFNDNYIKFLRNNYPNCKIAAYFQDMISRHYDSSEAKKLIGLCDIALSYDRNDCEKYGLNYYGDVYSILDVPAAEEKSDVCCVINAKNRLNKIEMAYDVLIDKGLKCDFYIVGVKDKNHEKKAGIVYGKQLPYSEVIKKVKASKAILEIMQEGAVGYTLRTCEAIVYGKKLITDNAEVVSEPFYTPKNVSVIKRAEDISPAFINGEVDTAAYRGYAEKLSPLKLLEFIEEKL